MVRELPVDMWAFVFIAVKYVRWKTINSGRVFRGNNDESFLKPRTDFINFQIGNWKTGRIT